MKYTLRRLLMGVVCTSLLVSGCSQTTAVNQGHTQVKDSKSPAVATEIISQKPQIFRAFLSKSQGNFRGTILMRTS